MKKQINVQFEENSKMDIGRLFWVDHDKIDGEAYDKRRQS